jgi:hypothetical protein
MTDIDSYPYYKKLTKVCQENKIKTKSCTLSTY